MTNLPIISITSWKARITTVGLTIYSLITNCPGYKILLTLSLEEFPRGINDMPADIQKLISTGTIEIAWTNDNPREFKKLKAFELYPDNPCVFVDDDIFYTKNFVLELFNLHKQNSNVVYSWQNTHTKFGCGMACSLFPPSVFDLILKSMKDNTNLHDDALFPKVFAENNIRVVGLYDKFPGIWHDETCPLNGTINVPAWIAMQTF
jgi:hypothetical protein